MIAYHTYVLTAEEVSACDPFDGQGIRLDFLPEWPAGESEQKIAALGDIPRVAWETHAWLDGGALSKQDQEKIIIFWAELLSDSGLMALDRTPGE